MSLTSHLRSTRSPVRDFIHYYAAAIADAKRGTLWGTQLQRLLTLDRLPVKAAVLPSTAEPRFRGTVGTAFDYRLRFYLPERSTKHLVARSGAMVLALEAREPGVIRQRVEWMMENLEELLSTIAPGRPTLDDETERLLCRYCAALAELEAAFRSPYRPQMPTTRNGSRNACGDEPLLDLASSQIVDDVFLLSKSVPEDFGAIIDVVMQGIPYIPNPTFAGSLDVGGADADMIVGETIFEVKTSGTLTIEAVRDALLQLVGYALLDYDDKYGIRNVAVYFARHRWVAGWPLWRLILPVADIIRHLDETEPSEDEVLERLDAGRQGLRAAVAAMGPASLEDSEIPPVVRSADAAP
jgi:hypothetical protein